MNIMDIMDIRDIMEFMDIMDIMDIMDVMDIMDIMDIMDVMDIMDIMIITAWLAMAGAVSALVLLSMSVFHPDEQTNSKRTICCSYRIGDNLYRLHYSSVLVLHGKIQLYNAIK